MQIRIFLDVHREYMNTGVTIYTSPIGFSYRKKSKLK